MTLEGVGGLGGFTHVGVQVDPTESNFQDVEKAKNYVKRYFLTDRMKGLGPNEPSISVYWGSATDFLMDLTKALGIETEASSAASSGG